MKKKFIDVAALDSRYQELSERELEMIDLLEREARERTDAETKEYQEILREKELLVMRMNAAAAANTRENGLNVLDADAIVRENMEAGKQTKVRLVRSLVMVSDASTGGIIPLKIQDILDPLVEGLILDKVGLPMPTGLAGDYVWPTYETVEATIAGEGVALTDTKISMSKLTASPQRIGIAIPITRQTIIQTEGVIETVAKKLIPLSISMLLNKIMFSTTKITNATTLAGPFVGKLASAVTLSSVPTFKELNLLKAKILASGIDGNALCWVMTKANKAILESTPKDAGSGIMVCEDDKIAGLPVFTSNYIGEGYIGLGDWRYQPMGLFGDISFIIDPYSQARKDAVDFVFNVNYGTATLRSEAFCLGKITPEVKS